MYVDKRGKNGERKKLDKEIPVSNISDENLYCLNGRVPLKKAISFGLQHVLAMFVSNLAPVLIVCSAAFIQGTNEHLTPAEITEILQCAMFAAGLGTIMQLYPVWKIGSKLPIVMGVSFTFLGSLLVISTNPDLGYEDMVGAIIMGGIFEGIVGLSAKYWRRFLTPVVSACVVIAIGLSLLSVGNVGLVTMTGVINRFTICIGALILILASLFPPFGAFFNSIPQSVLGGCTVMMFGSIMYEGIKMLKDCVFDDQTMIIVSLSFCIGVGLTQTTGNFFSAFPQAVGDVFNGNAVAGVFVVSLLLSLFLLKEKNEK